MAKNLFFGCALHLGATTLVRWNRRVYRKVERTSNGRMQEEVNGTHEGSQRNITVMAPGVT